MSSDKLIAIIDYNMGNLRSVEKAFLKIGGNAIVTKDKQLIKSADKIVLPGVGAFKEGIEELKKLDLLGLLNELVLEYKRKVFGICLGMQIMATKSYEMGETPGLNWIEGEVVKFDIENLKVPHVGWNNIHIANSNGLFKNIPDQTDFYFVHSFYLKSSKEYITSTTDYGVDFVSSVNKDNVFGCQFHPEKSQKYGLEILKNFVNLK